MPVKNRKEEGFFIYLKQNPRNPRNPYDLVPFLFGDDEEEFQFDNNRASLNLKIIESYR